MDGSRRSEEATVTVPAGELPSNNGVALTDSAHRGSADDTGRGGASPSTEVDHKTRQRALVLDKLNPILQVLVTQLCGAMPADPIEFCVNYLQLLQQGDRPSKERDELTEANTALQYSLLNLNQSLHEHMQLVRSIMDQDSDVSLDEGYRKPVTKHRLTLPEAVQDLLWQWFRPLYPFANMSDFAFAELLAECTRLDVPPGTTLHREGDPVEHVILVLKGDIKLTNSSAAQLGRGLNFNPWTQAGTGDILNAVEVLRGLPASYTALTAVASAIFKVPAAAYLRLGSQAGLAALGRRFDIARSLLSLAQCSDEVVRDVSDSAIPRNFSNNGVVVREGSVGQSSYIVDRGRCQAFFEAAPVPNLVFVEGSSFCSIGTLLSHHRRLTVQTACPMATILEIPKALVRAVVAAHRRQPGAGVADDQVGPTYSVGDMSNYDSAREDASSAGDAVSGAGLSEGESMLATADENTQV